MVPILAAPLVQLPSVLSASLSVSKAPPFSTHLPVMPMPRPCPTPDFHLGDQGHKVVSDLVVHALQQQLVGLVLQPWSAEEAEALGEQMMPPMHEGTGPLDTWASMLHAPTC